MNVHTIPVTTHGRYLVEAPASDAPRGWLFAFHGYSEHATVQMARLRAMPGADDWVCVSVQALHRFYRGTRQAVAASWMTSEDRDLAIRDNIAYVDAVIERIVTEWPVDGGALVFAGFSQGVAMAFRAACASVRPVAAVIALGGDVPPELDADALRHIGHVFYGRGDHDEWYSADQFAADQECVRRAGVDLTTCRLDDDHAWTAGFSDAVGHFLQGLASPRH